MASPYREEDESRFRRIETRLGALEAREHPGFVERWRARAEAFRAFVFPMGATLGTALVVWGIAFTVHTCSVDSEAARRGAAERCAAVCEAIGMHGSALDTLRVEVDDPPYACFCGEGTHLVSIRHDGTVTGIDTANGHRFGDGAGTEAPR